MRPFRRSAALLAAQALALALAVAGVGGAEDEPPPPAPIHADGRVVEQAVLDAALAYLREDAPAARQALDRIETGCRRISDEGDSGYSDQIVRFDQAFRLSLDAAREFAGRGMVEKSFEEFFWVQRGCRRCHSLAREDGLAVTVPTVGNGSTSGSAP